MLQAVGERARVPNEKSGYVLSSLGSLERSLPFVQQRLLVVHIHSHPPLCVRSTSMDTWIEAYSSSWPIREPGVDRSDLLTVG